MVSDRINFQTPIFKNSYACQSARTESINRRNLEISKNEIKTIQKSNEPPGTRPIIQKASQLKRECKMQNAITKNLKNKKQTSIRIIHHEPTMPRKK
jgi:hypothetical protein